MCAVRAGVPLRVVFQSRLASRRLRSALAAVPLGDVELHHSLMKLHRRTLSAVVSALATSAATLTALRALPLEAALRDRPQLGLAALTQLRAVSFYQAVNALEGLQATHLPTSLQKLELICFDPEEAEDWDHPMPPALIDFDRLHNLRRISLSLYASWQLSSRDNETGSLRPPQLPQSMEARPATVLPQCVVWHPVHQCCFDLGRRQSMPLRETAFNNAYAQEHVVCRSSTSVALVW